ncbi:hypothetical protein KUCAC02_012315 [Chaenocephalus aceratus]|uniref:Uncharacterized protein n=1 Tax=Chaenocephalus aceratus TaxID=36190 RepID=A0ACB9XA75_CHAAC|nr:hypothetical protein KUCAC02_012315 [Chaenocephalus aceratus]
MLKPVPGCHPAVEERAPSSRTRSIEDEEEGDLVVVVHPAVEERAPHPLRRHTLPRVASMARPSTLMATPAEFPHVTMAGPAPSPDVARRSARDTAVRHSNPHHLPVAVGNRASGATASQLPSTSSSTLAYF